ncbi:sugar phosphate isomerase/epimerase family protein [Phyllobacterium brassicacearum]|nr:sugar phosphate isomerase/epimerase family protein [Phyllobacterium brassicacearum]TDQ16715.1 deoxyribonuclease-4 [Phyllobacterium brassicacearum]
MQHAFGVHTFGFVWNETAVEALGKLAQQGFRKFQLLASDPHFNIREHGSSEWVAVRDQIASIDGNLLALDLPVGDYNLASPMPDVTQFAIAAHRRAVDAAAFLGASHITVGSGRKHALIPAKSGVLEEIFRNSLMTLADYARERGIRILFENHPLGVFPDAASMNELLEQCAIDTIDVVYDVANARAIGEGPCTGLELLRDRLRVIHLSDSMEGKWQHAPIGSGQVDFRNILQTIQRIGFEGDIVIEIISEDPLADAVSARVQLKHLI